jgi:predicted DNA-binding transcriptional regulator AlpA
MTDDDELIRAKGVRKLLDDCSDMHIWRLVNDGQYAGLNFPKPLKIGRMNYWRRREIQEWIRQRPIASSTRGQEAVA